MQGFLQFVDGLIRSFLFGMSLFVNGNSNRATCAIEQLTFHIIIHQGYYGVDDGTPASSVPLSGV